MRRKALLVAMSVACLLAAGGLVCWHLWPQPPAPTAEEVFTEVMAADPAKLPDERFSEWVTRSTASVEKLPPHEFDRLVRRCLADPTFRQRVVSLSWERRREFSINQVSPQHRARLMAVVGSAMVQFAKSLPAPLRRHAVRQFYAGYRHDSRDPRFPKPTTRELVGWKCGTTARQRAEFVRSLRDMRGMLEEADVDP